MSEEMKAKDPLITHDSSLITPVRGRGASWNPLNRFESIEYVRDEEAEDQPAPNTIFLRDPTRTILAHNDSPDAAFDSSFNPTRGCGHGSISSFPRPPHEYLAFSAGL